MLADEPTGALDSANSEQLFSLIESLCVGIGLTAIVATHDPLVANHAHRQVEVRDGVIAA